MAGVYKQIKPHLKEALDLNRESEASRVILCVNICMKLGRHEGRVMGKETNKNSIEMA